MPDTKLTALSAASAPLLTDIGYLVTDPAGTPASAKAALANLLGVGAAGICQGRLTLTTGVPVTTTDVTGAGTVYFTPYNGNLIALYSGTTWNLRSFSELSISLASGYTSGKPYDVFAYDNSGAVAVETLVWTNDTTRATALTLQNGVPVKTGATTRRYLGTFYTTSSTTTEDSQVIRYVWNQYNRVPRTFARALSSASHTYNSTTYRAFGNDTTNRFDLVCGQAVEAVSLGAVAAANGGPVGVTLTFGEDSTTAEWSGFRTGHVVASTTWYWILSIGTKVPDVGKHAYTYIESSNGPAYGGDGANLTMWGDWKC